MGDFFRRLAFHRSGKPRRWLLFVLFQDGMVARPLFRRIVHKRSGKVRPKFAYWVNVSGKVSPDVDPKKGVLAQPSESIHPAELHLGAMSTLDEMTQTWRHGKSPEHLLSQTDLFDLLLAERVNDTARLIVAISHDNYMKYPGGVQLCIQHEQARAVENGDVYLQLHPWQPLPRLAHFAEEPDVVVSLILNGRPIGNARTSGVIDAARQAAASRMAATVVVHHLLGHLPEQVSELVQATAAGRCIFWLHDFFSLCPNYTLQRNGLVFCNAPPAASNACGLCVFGRERATHQARIRMFFEATSVDILSPSSVTADFWKGRSSLPYASLTIQPHVTLAIEPRSQPLETGTAAPIVIGYIGVAVQHKGWPIFENLLRSCDGSESYRFVVLSNKRPNVGESSWRSVQTTASRPDAMSDAVAEENIDFVLHWPTWPETFSLTTYEAIIGSAYVITHGNSGNVAAAVKATGRGVILEDEDDLHAFFRDGRAAAVADARRTASKHFQVVPQRSDMSLSFLEGS